MPTLKLTDNVGLVIDATLSADATFAKYLKSPSELIGVLTTVKPIQDLRISDDPFQSQSAGIAFTEPITLGATGAELSIKPSLTGSLSITKGPTLFSTDTDAFREVIPIPAQQAYLSAALTAEMDLAIAGKVTDLQFGFTAGTTIVLTNYRLCAITDPLVPALKHLVADFTLPGDLEDIAHLAEHDIITIDGTGTLHFTAEANLLTSVNPLAMLDVPFVPIKVAEGAGINVKGAYTLTGAYQLRIQRLDGRKFRLGYQKKRTSEFDVSTKALINTSVTAGSFDLLKTVLQAVSPDPVPDQATFQEAGLTDDKIGAIAAAVKAGIERSIALSLTRELDLLDSSSTAFSYEVDIGQLDDRGKQAVHDALDADLTGLEATEHPGITRKKSVFDTLRQGSRILKVNLLGIYTHASVTTLFQKGTIIVDRETGDVTITDQAGAQRIQFTADNFAQDSVRLRRVLAESLLLTAVYRAAAGFMGGPQLTSHYWFFELHQKTNQQQIADYLTIAQALQLLSPTARTAKLTSIAAISAFGRSSLFIDASYNDALCKLMFVDSTGQARAEDEYEASGRLALLLLLPQGDPINDARRMPLNDDALWQTMKRTGQPGFPTLFAAKGLNANQLADITADYTLIMWWASAMHQMGDALAQILNFLTSHAGVDRENNTFRQLRITLNDAMAAVVSTTHPQFGEPWGILALDLASGQQATTSLQLVTPKMTLVLTQRALQGATSHGN